MKKFAMLLLAVVVPVFLTSLGAQARKADWKGRLVQKCEKAGAIQAADREGAMTAWKALKECRIAVKKGEKPKGSCIQLRIDWKKARLAVFEKCKGFDKLPKRLMRQVHRRIKFLTRNIAKMEERAAKLKEAPKEPAKDAPKAEPGK